jgi:hypothetical protein
MLITAGELPFGEQDMRCASWEDHRFLVRWKGLIYLHGVSSGVATIQQIAQRLPTTPLTFLCRELHGIFGLFIFDKTRCLWQIAVDNSGLYHVFHDQDTVSSSFLELLAFKGLSSRHICPVAAAEFLAHGGVYWRRTLVVGIAKIGHDEIIELEPGSAGTKSAKRIARKELPLPGGNQESFVAHYAYLAEALADRRVSVDLTGGFDSRLNACLLTRHGLDFEVATSGRSGIPDVVIPERAAKILGREFRLTLHDISSLDKDLPRMFREGDGLTDLVVHHRARQLQAERKRRGIEVAISGVGGELYKDFWWLQDTPRYSSRRVNFERLYDLRIMPVPLPPHYLAGDVADAYAQLRRLTLERFADLRAATNTESYDNLYFYYKMPEFAGRFLTNHIDNYLNVVAPLLEYDNVMFAFGLPRSIRSFNRFHRRVLSEQCPKLARLMTSSGVSASADGWRIARDGIGCGVTIGRRLTRKIGQRLFGRAWLQSPGPDEPTMRSRVRRGSEFLQSLTALKDLRMLASELTPDEVRDADVGRILALGMLVRRLES